MKPRWVELQRAGTSVELGTEVRVHSRNKKRMVVCAGSPSGQRSPLNL